MRGKKGNIILARNHYLIEELIEKWGQEHPELKVPADFKPGDPEKGLPPPIGIRYRKNGSIKGVDGVEIELFPEFDGSRLSAAEEERYEESVEPEVVEDLQEEFHGGNDPDLFNIVGTQVIDVKLKKNGWLVTVQISNFGVGYSKEGQLELNVVNVHSEELVGQVVSPVGELKGGEKLKMKIRVPSEGKPSRDVAVGVSLEGPDLLADDNDDWFIPWKNELEDLQTLKKKVVKGMRPDVIVLLENPKMWVENGEGAVFVLSALVSSGDSSHRLGKVKLNLTGKGDSISLKVDAYEGVVWAVTLDLERRTIPAKALIYVPIDDALRTAVTSGALVPDHIEVTVSGKNVKTMTKEFPLDPLFISELRNACGGAKVAEQ